MPKKPSVLDAAGYAITRGDTVRLTPPVRGVTYGEITAVAADAVTVRLPRFTGAGTVTVPPNAVEVEFPGF